MILVEIFSEDCECFVEAEVIESVNSDGYITAKVVKDNYSCDQCDTCWKDITTFKKGLTRQIK